MELKLLWAYWRDRINKLADIPTIQQREVESLTIMENCYSLINRVDALNVSAKERIAKAHLVTAAINLAWSANAAYDVIISSDNPMKVGAAASLMSQSLARADSEFALVAQDQTKLPSPKSEKDYN
jgi:hypothetical protein